MSQQKMSHSLNRFRTKMRKQFKGSGHDGGKNSPDSASKTSPGSGGGGAGGLTSSTSMINTSSATNSPSGFLGPPKRAVSVSSAPDVTSSPVHQSRKTSLTADSPIHSLLKNTPTSPLVNAKLPGLSPSGHPEVISNNGVVTNGTASVSSRSSTPVLALPKVSIAGEDMPLDRQGIIDITVNVHSFLAAISKLKQAMDNSDNPREEASLSQDSEVAGQPGSPPYSSSITSESPDVIISHVTQLIQVVQTCLNEHGSMQSTGIKDAAMDLMNTYRNCDHVNPSTCDVCSAAIDTLIDAFTESVSEYLTGESGQSDSSSSFALPSKDLGSQRKGLERAGIKGFSKSHDNLVSKFNSYSTANLAQQFNDSITDEIDQALFGTEKSIEVAARYIKLRMKYHKEVVSYLSKRAQIEANYAKQMMSLGTKTSRNLQEMAEEHHLPLIDIFRGSIEQDMHYATNSNTTFNAQTGAKLIEPLDEKTTECEKLKKELNTTWRSETKKLSEAKTAMKNAMSRYRFLGEDLARVKNLLALDPLGKHAEKRKKEVTDLETKWQEAEVAYKQAVALCNDCQYQVHITAQRSILCAYRRMVIDDDIQFKEGLESYFQLQQNFFASLPEPMAHYHDRVSDYRIGSEFMEYIQRHARRQEEPEDYLFEEFDPEAESLMETHEKYVGSMADLPTSASSDSTFLNPGATEDGVDRAPSPQPFLDPPYGNPMAVETRGSQGSHSPRSGKRKMRPHSELMEPGTGDSKNGLSRRNSEQVRAGGSKETLSPPTATPLPQQPVAQGSIPYSRMALTHTFKKLRGPARCRECDTYVYFHGHECDICGLACHKKCLETLAIRCGNKRLARKMNTFGVDFHKHLKATKRYIPIIVTKCIEEIDERALNTRGLYRISSAKTKLEHLCQLFESGADRVDLSDRPSHLIGSCLKLYFRQLPEPLLTFGLYHDFVTFARECSYILPCKLESVSEEKRETALDMLERLKGLLQKLPYENYITLAKLLYHLKKVSHPDNVKHNFMPPSNLGIVFGPNLLRQREQVASLALLHDMTAQAKAIEIMISHVNELFHLSEEKIREVEHEYDDEGDFTKEVSVDEPAESIKSPQLDLDDVATVGSRTPYNTPPERRRENVYELGEVLEVLQSVGRRNLEAPGGPKLSHHPLLGDFRDHPISHSLPSFNSPSPSPSNASTPSSTHIPNFPNSVGSDDSTLSSLSRYLRSTPTGPNPAMEKMLTPVEEKPAEVEDDRDPFSDDEYIDDETNIISSSSQKIDDNFSRSASGMSNLGGASWMIDSAEVSSVKSILSGGGAEREKRGGADRDMGILGRLGDSGHSALKTGSQSSEELDDSELSRHRTFSSSTDPTPSADAARGQGVTDTPTITSQQLSTGENQSSSNVTTISRFLPYPKRSSLREGRNYGGSQCSSPLSSTSHATVSSQSSYSEITGDEMPRASSSNDLTKLRKVSMSEKYARYEAYRKSQIMPDSPVEKEEEEEAAAGEGREGEEKKEEGVDEMQDAAQDSNGTLTNESTDDISAESAETVGEGDNSGGVKNLLIDAIKDSSKHCDSGIDETPEGVPGGARRLSMPPTGSSSGSGPEDPSAPPDTKPLSHTLAFASRESGLADSPDPEVLSDEAALLKLVKQSSIEAERLRKERSGVTEVEILLPADDNSKLGLSSSLSLDEHRGGSFKSKTDKFSSSFERPVLRSLDNPSFSRYARTPIRDSKLLRASDSNLHEGVGGLRYRSVSMDKIPMSYLGGGDRGSTVIENPGSSRTYSMSSSRSSVMPVSPVRQPSASMQARHPNQRFCVNADLKSPTSPPFLGGPSFHPLDSGSEPGSPSPPVFISQVGEKEKVKKSKKMKDRFKPALRVLKISPGSVSCPSPILTDPPPLEVDEQVEGYANSAKIDDDDTNFCKPEFILTSPISPEVGGERVKMTPTDSKTTPSDSTPLTETSLKEHQAHRRARMMSPEAMITHLTASGKVLRRSQSSDDILESGGGSRGSDAESAKQPSSTKIGSLVVIPEPTKKSTKEKLFEKLKGRRSKGNSPSLLRKSPHSMSTDALPLSSAHLTSLTSENGSKSPKNRKRHRTPHFV